MISRTSVRWRLVAWVTGVLLAVAAVIFVVVYEQTGTELRAEVDQDVAGDLSQLAQAVKGARAASPETLLAQIGVYLRGQPFGAASSLLFASVPGHGSVSNPPSLLGNRVPDNGETVAEQDQENTLGQALLRAPTRITTQDAPDIGDVRLDERTIRVRDFQVRVGAGEPLAIVTRAQRSIVRSFVIAGALALVLALIASYLAGASVSLPLRRMARVAAQVDDGDLHPRMDTTRLAADEIRVLAESFNRMLDRLSEAFASQRDFIADASHELRTPLTVIGGQLEVLAAQEHPAPQEVRRVERLVAAEIARTSRLVDDMLLLARSERRDFLQYRELELEPFVAELWLGARIGEERRFELSPIPDAMLTADADRLAQALRNLIRNAVEHTAAPDGLVRLEVTARPGGLVRFVVLDDGPGIDDDELEQVFERFHRTDDDRSRKTGGAGLGLAIVRAIAQAHGGDARAVHNPAGGARLELDLPRLRARSVPPGMEHGEPPAVAAPRLSAPVEAGAARGPRRPGAGRPDAS
ncbi:MAG TPA: HAMP domain-containing sensor histidine kinase [Solirubrobacteraceae bacterium]|jgi:signal transduction histidine kinase|nr:HAMP domain-containing sensor histidine kinase [Solirubrobacteraceae bacterium]